MNVTLFITCYNDTLFPETGKAVVRVLERLGHTVEFRQAQTCCGQMHYNTGYQHDAPAHDAAFPGGVPRCRNHLRPLGFLRGHDPRPLSENGGRRPATAAGRDVEDLLPRVFEFSELLVDKLGVTDVGAPFPHTVTLHTSCHSLRSLQIGDRPLRLLAAACAGLTLRGTAAQRPVLRVRRNLRHQERRRFGRHARRKSAAILDTQAEVCTAVDNSCLMHIGGALSRQRAGVRCLHLAEILASTAGGAA